MNQDNQPADSSPLAIINGKPVYRIAGAEDDPESGMEEEATEITVDPVLAKLAAIEAQNVQLLEATRTAQGQARRAEQVAMETAQRLLDREQKPTQTTGDAVTQLVSKLNDANPAEKLIKDALLTQQQTINTLVGEVQAQKGHRQVTEAQQAEKIIRDHTANELLDRAQDMGLDIESTEFKQIAEKIGKLDTGPNGTTMWTEGKKILREARSKPVGEEQPTAYTERRGATGARPRSKVEIEQAYADGNISTEEYASWQRSH